MKYYGIRNKDTGKPYGITYQTNPEGCESTDVSFELDLYADNVWLLKDKAQVQRVLETNTEWFNAGYSSPSWDYKAPLSSRAEIFEIEI